jgi:TatD DNase family protein
MQLKYINTHSHKIDNEADCITIYNYCVGELNNNYNLFSAGIHPWFIKKDKIEEQFAELKIISRQKNCLAIGECGLDKIKGAEHKLQEQVFIKQIQLAKDFNKPLIIHNVQFFQRILEICAQQKFSGKLIFHGFNSKIQNSEKIFSNQSIYFSFGKSILNQNSNANQLIKQLPKTKFLLETDDADFSIQEIYNKAAQLLSINLNELMLQMNQNFNFVFNYGND